jgi:hypothetical protein
VVNRLYAAQDRGKWRYRNTEELERQLFFDTEYTFPCWSSKRRRADPSGFRDARECLLGNAYHPGCLAFLISQLFLHEGWINQELCINQLVQHRVRLLPAGGHPRDASPAPVPTDRSGLLLSMVRWLFLRQTARGGEVRTIFGTPHIKGFYQEIPATWFRWHVLLSVPWRSSSSHINVCEARARCLAVKLRARQARLHRTKFLHLLDSQVNLAQSAKGRTSSKRMAHVLRQTSAIMLATGMRDVVGFTRSEMNPADHASRDLRGWQHYRSQMRRSAKRWSVSSGPCVRPSSVAPPSTGSGAAPRPP